MITIINAKVYIDGTFRNTNISFDKTIVDISNDIKGDEVIDAYGKMVIPGLIDIHTHGMGGISAVNESDSQIGELSHLYAKCGITSFCPTLSTVSEETMRKSINCISNHERKSGESKIVGINLEGPFISPDMMGSQNIAHQNNPNIDMLNRIYSDLVKIITVAPELPGALDFISHVTNTYEGKVTVSLGHTKAPYEIAKRAFENGASHVTHLYNRMTPINHREPGIIPAAVSNNATAEIICDGVHVHPAMVRMAHDLFGNRLCLISDSLPCSGLPEGIYDFEGTSVEVRQDAVYVDKTKNLAGAVKNLAECIKVACEMGVHVENAIMAATYTPARILGIDNVVGMIDEGRVADLVVMDCDYNVTDVYVDGENIR